MSVTSSAGIDVRFDAAASEESSTAIEMLSSMGLEADADTTS